MNFIVLYLDINFIVLYIYNKYFILLTTSIRVVRVNLYDLHHIFVNRQFIDPQLNYSQTFLLHPV